VAFNKKLSRRDFMKLIAAGGTTIFLGSIFGGGFSSLFSPNTKNQGSVQQAAAQSAPGNFVLGPNTEFIAMHLAHLPNGRIMYAAGSGYSELHKTGPYQWGVFNPSNESMTNHTVNEDLFCMGQAVLITGKVLCAGGTLRYDTDDPDGLWKGLASAFEYDPDSDSLVKVQSMHHGRWYPYCITLENSQVVTIGGWDEWGCRNMLCEIYDPGSKSWTIKYNPSTSVTYTVGSCNPSAPAGLPTYGGSGQGVMPPVSLYPRALYMPTGLVAVAGQNPTTYTVNPETGRWVRAGILAVARSYGNMALLPLNNDLSETGQLIVWGGSSNSGTNATTVVELLTPNSGTNFTTFSFQTITPCNFGRRHAPAVYLPDGKLISFGGAHFQNDLSTAFYNAEIFDPVARSWTVVDGMTVPKLYHSAGILLPDGRVWLTGNSISKSNWELRSEYYVPAYYNATRPTISSDPAVGNYGETINIPTPDAASIEKVSLIRLSTFTHGFDSELRFIWLQIQSKGSNSVTVSAPLNGKIAPPGYYMIHVLNSAGAPSTARVIKIPGTASPPPGDTTIPTVDITSPADGSTITGPSTGVTIDVTGTAADESGGSGIQQVEVQVGSNPFKLATATGPGGSGDWSTWSASDVVTTEGGVVITARATDNAGNVREDTINVTTSFEVSNTYTTIYSQAGTNSYIVLNSGGFHRAGEIMTPASTLIGNSVKRVSVILKRGGSPTGFVYVRFRRGTDDSIAKEFGRIDAATLTTTDQTFTLESPTSQTFAANDKILVEWGGTGTNTDQVHVKRHAYSSSDASFDGINTRQTHKLATSTGYSTYNNADIAGVWERSEGQSSGDTTIPTVDITSPADGSTITGPSTGVTIDVTGTAADESGGSGIQQVEVQVGSNPFKLATATGPGGSGDWSTWSASDVVTTEGGVVITARATDNAGNVREDTINVTTSFEVSNTYTTIYSQAGTNSYIVLNSGGFHRAGEIMTPASTLIGNSVKRVSVILKRGGSPTGFVYVRFRRGTDDSIAKEFGRIDAATLTTTDQTFTLESPTSQTFAANDKILVEWGGTGTNTDQVHVKRHAYSSSDASFDGINTRQTHKLATSTGYNTYNNADIAGVWYRSG
jgi:hypothetical protein